MSIPEEVNSNEAEGLHGSFGNVPSARGKN